ncbi:glutamine amidotransferase-related protein [Aurantivibrio infirmus]
MIIGLLEAETLPPKIIKEYGSYGEMFVTFLNKTPNDFSFRFYAVDQQHLPLTINECDAYIVTGSRYNAFDDTPWINDLKDFIRELYKAQKKCFGVCFGHQIIAEALGGKVERNSKGWGVGAKLFKTVHQPGWATQTPDYFTILVSHQDQVTRLPSRATLFATSEYCTNGAYFIDDFIFCLQGHPEFSIDYLLFLLTKRREVIGSNITANALKSLDISIDQHYLQSLMLGFFKT